MNGIEDDNPKRRIEKEKERLYQEKIHLASVELTMFGYDLEEEFEKKVNDRIRGIIEKGFVPTDLERIQRKLRTEFDLPKPEETK